MWRKRKVWWLDDPEGNPTVVIYNKPVNEERAKMTYWRWLNPDLPIKEYFK